jgi:N-acetylmuramoyl-L-alanine amidase
MLKSKAFVLTKSLLLFSFLPVFSQTPPVKKINTIIVDAGHGGKDGGAHGAYEGGLYSWEKNVTLAISLKVVDELKKQLPGVKVVPTRTSDIYQSPPEKADIANQNKGDLFVCIHADATQLKTGSRITGYRTVTVYDNKVEWIKKGKKKVKKVTKVPREVEKPIIEYFKIGTSRSGTSVWIFAPHKTSAKLAAIEKDETFEAQTSSDSTYENLDFNSQELRMLANIKMARYQQRSSRLAGYINQEVDKTGREGLGVNQRQVGIWVLQATNMPAVLVETGFISNHDDERYLNSEAGQQELAVSIVKAIKHYKEVIENPMQATGSDSAGTK